MPLYLIALFASFFATKLVTTELFGLSPGIYDYYFHLYLPPIDIVFSVIKVVVFAVVVTLIHCYYGYYATGGPAGVGVAVGRAIRSIDRHHRRRQPPAVATSSGAAAAP